MRIILLWLCLCVLCLSCQDKQSKKNNASPAAIEQVTKSKDIKKDSVIKPEREYPLLTDKNALEFFLQYNEDYKENKVRISTDFGDIDILLFDETRFHRSNFIFLVKQKYFDGTQFYRVVNDFIIQGGNSDENKIAKRRKKIGKYLLPPDTKRGFKHDRGVISMPSSDIENPYKLASPYEFFIVQKRGGSHHLNGDFTIFGRVIKGMSVVDEIAAQKTDNREWPLKNVYIRTVRIIE